MLTRHLNELLSRLDRVADIGCAEIRKVELLLWYGQERLTTKIWRDLSEKWEEMEQGAPLLVGEADGVWTLIWGEGLKTTHEAWFKDVRVRAKLNTDEEFEEEAA